MNTTQRSKYNDITSILSHIIALATTFRQEIQQLKCKIIGYPQFNAQSAFFYIDTSKKGYITNIDLQQIIQNKIKDRFIKILIKRYSSNGQNKMTYMDFLNFIKPNLNRELAEDLLRRNNKLKLNQILESLFTQLIFIEAVFTTELELLKQELAQKYCLNQYEIRSYLPQDISDVGIHKFVNQNNYELDIDKIKYLRTYKVCSNKFNLNDQVTIKQLFMVYFQNQKLNLKNTKIELENKKQKQIQKRNQKTQYTRVNFLNFKIHKQNIQSQNIQQNINELTITQSQFKQQMSQHIPKLNNISDSRNYSYISHYQNDSKVPILQKFMLYNPKLPEIRLDTFNAQNMQKMQKMQKIQKMQKKKITTNKKRQQFLKQPQNLKKQKLYQRNYYELENKYNKRFLIDNFLKKSNEKNKQLFNDSLDNSNQSALKNPFQYY